MPFLQPTCSSLRTMFTVVDRHVALLLEAAGVGEHEPPRIGVGLDPLLGLGNVLLASHAQAEDLKLVALRLGAVSLVVTH